MPKKVKRQQAPGSSKSITIHLKSARNPSLEFTIANAPLSTTSVEDLKDSVRDRVVDGSGGQVAVEKIKILYKRKPVTGKSVAEVLADEPEMLGGGKDVELGVMIIGGAKVLEAKSAEGEKKGEDVLDSATTTGKAILETEEFWNDLQSYLVQKLKDGEQATKLMGLFKDAWSASR